MRIEREPRDPGLYHGVEVALVHGKDAVHAPEVEAEAAVRGVDVTLERCPRPEGDHGEAMRGTDAHGLLHLRGALGKQDRVGRLRRDPRRRVGVLRPDGRGGDERVAKPPPQGGDGVGPGCGVLVHHGPSRAHYDG